MKTIRVIDTETTGTDPEKNAICEIASVDVDLSEAPGGKRLTRLMAARTQLVNPGHPMPPEARAIHHIGDADFKDARPLEKILPLVLNCLPQPTAFCAHYAKFEKGFLDQFTRGTPWVCSYKCALRRWPDAPGFSNQVLRYWLQIDIPSKHPTQPPHRALPDTVVTAHILSKLLEDVPLDTLIAWSAEPPLLPKISFGKHKGRGWSEPPSDYLDWIIEKSDLEDDVKWNARRERDRRAGDSLDEKKAAYVAAAKAVIKTAANIDKLRQWYADETENRHRLGIKAGTGEAQEIADACIARKTKLAKAASQSEEHENALASDAS